MTNSRSIPNWHRLSSLIMWNKQVQLSGICTYAYIWYLECISAIASDKFGVREALSKLSINYLQQIKTLLQVAYY